MKFENTIVSNFEGAFRGLRNPLESWNRSDSVFGITNLDSMLDYDIASLYCEKEGISIEDVDDYDTHQSDYAEWLRKNGILKWDDFFQNFEYAYIGPKDLDLAHRMIKAGSSDSKFLRQINVSVDITAPLYWWKELDTYKIGTVANSTSTMHKLATTPITKNCFELADFTPTLEFEREREILDEGIFGVYMQDFRDELIDRLEYLRIKYLETKDKRYWKELIRWLPESWLQIRTWTANYQTLRNIVSQRKNHRLKYEWDSFIAWCQTLPYADDLIFYNNGYNNGYILHNLLS